MRFYKKIYLKTQELVLQIFDLEVSKNTADVIALSVKNALIEVEEARKINKPLDNAWDLLDELIENQMIDRGLEDSKNNRMISNKQMQDKIKKW